MYRKINLSGGKGLILKLIGILLLLLFCLSSLISEPCGDVNSNGTINIVDALMTAQFYVGMNPQPFDQAAADVNKDGSINIIDALQLAQYYTGLITALPGCPLPASSGKPRVIIATDDQMDDRASLVRFLYSACDFDIVGIVLVAGRYMHTPVRSAINEKLDAYEEVLPNLRVHNPEYPDAAHLRARLYDGILKTNDLYTDPPDMKTQDTPGSQLIVDTLLDPDPRPLHIANWGGANTTAFALYRLQQSYSQADFERAVSKIRIYCIWYQDGGGQWIEDNIPGASIFEAFGWDNTWDYQSTGNTNPPEQIAYMTSSWLSENVSMHHGPLGETYEQSYVSEGDTPSFLHLINNGLRSHEDYTLGGWGGRAVYGDPVKKPNYLTDRYLNDDGSKKKHYWRWIIPAQNDFAARMDWGMAGSYSEANHQPLACVSGSYNTVPGGLGKTVAPGQTVYMDASSSSDPDGDSLNYNWWQYYEADSVSAQVSLSNNTSSQASFVVPDEPGKQIQIILEVIDNGSPNLVSYQRLLFDIR